MDDLDQAFHAAERLLAKSKQASDDYAQRRQHDDRSLIAKLIVYAFVGLIGFFPAIFGRGPVQGLERLG